MVYGNYSCICNNSIATVSATGLVTAVGQGWTTITAASAVAPSVTTTRVVTVNQPNPTSLLINPASVTLIIGENQQLTITTTPANANPDVTWSSSNNSIASITSSGIVYANLQGQVTITATSTVAPSVTTTRIVTVNQPNPTSLIINHATVTLFIGGTQQLTITPTPANANPNVTWSSNNNAIATISTSGLVTAVGQGQATITATSTVAPSITITSVVTVNQPNPVSLLINPATVTLIIGETEQLTITTIPVDADPSVTWSSSNNAIATISTSGLVTAVGQGQATITATSTVAPSVTTTRTVTVNQPNPTSLLINPATVTLIIGENQQLTITTTPANANSNVTWSSSNTSVTTVSDSGLVTAIGPGQATITANSEVVPNISNTRIITVQFPNHHTFSVSNLNQWQETIQAIGLSGNNKTYTINIVGNFSIPGVSNNTFGNLTGINITISGNHTIALSSSGSILWIGEHQHVILDNVELFGREMIVSFVRVDGNQAIFTMQGSSVITGHQSSLSSGTVYIANLATFNMNSGSITNNTTRAGGGVYVGTNGYFNMYGGSITNNTAFTGGGVILTSAGTNSNPGFNMYGGTISGNSSTSDIDGGGGVCISRSTFVMHGGTISGNTAQSFGGGIQMYHGTPSNRYCRFIMVGGTVYGSVDSGAPSHLANHSSYYATLHRNNPLVIETEYGNGTPILGVSSYGTSITIEGIP